MGSTVQREFYEKEVTEVRKVSDTRIHVTLTEEQAQALSYLLGHLNGHGMFTPIFGDLCGAGFECEVPVGWAFRYPNEGEEREELQSLLVGGFWKREVNDE